MKNRSSFFKTIAEGIVWIPLFPLLVILRNSLCDPLTIRTKIAGLYRTTYPSLLILPALATYAGAALYTGNPLPPLQPTLLAITVSIFYAAGASSLDFCFDSKIDKKLGRDTPITLGQLTLTDTKFFYIFLTMCAIVVSSLVGLNFYLLSLVFIPLSLFYSAGIRLSDHHILGRLSDHHILGNITLIILGLSLPMMIGAIAVGGRLRDPLLIVSSLLLLAFAVGVDLHKDLVKENMDIDEETGRRTLSKIIGRSGALAVSVSFSLLGALGTIFVINWLRVDAVRTPLVALALLSSLFLTIYISRDRISRSQYMWWSGLTYFPFLSAFIL